MLFYCAPSRGFRERRLDRHSLFVWVSRDYRTIASAPALAAVSASTCSRQRWQARHGWSVPSGCFGQNGVGAASASSAVPVVQIPQHEIMWHKLDHRAGFLLSRIDGQLSFEDLLDVSGMSEFEACRILSQLMGQGVIGPRR